jgi:hypothetical protein
MVAPAQNIQNSTQMRRSFSQKQLHVLPALGRQSFWMLEQRAETWMPAFGGKAVTTAMTAPGQPARLALPFMLSNRKAIC